MNQNDRTRQKLTNDQARRWPLIRYVAVGLMAVFYLGAALLLLVCLYVGAMTLRASYDKYLAPVVAPDGQRTAAPESGVELAEEVGQASGKQRDLIAKGPFGSLTAALIHADLTGFTWFILGLFSALLLFHAFRNRDLLEALPHDFWQHAYFRPAFPAGLDMLCVRLGLLGTIVSMTLNAFQWARDSVGAAGSGSQDVFLVLSASLISTAVGCTVGYVVIPAIGWTNWLAMGCHQVPAPASDEQQLADRLEPILAALERLGGAVGTIVPNAQTAAKASQKLSELLVRLGQIADAATAATAKLDAIGQKMDTASNNLTAGASRLKTISDSMAQLPASLQKQSAAAKQAYDKLGSMGAETALAQRKMAELTEHLTQPVGQAVTVLGTALRILSEVRSAVVDLAANQQKQTIHLGKLHSTGERFAAAMSELQRKVELMVGKAETRDTEEARGYGDIKKAIVSLAQDVRNECQALRATVETIVPEGEQACHTSSRIEQLPSPGNGNGKASDSSWWAYVLSWRWR